MASNSSAWNTVRRSGELTRAYEDWFRSKYGNDAVHLMDMRTTERLHQEFLRFRMNLNHQRKEGLNDFRSHITHVSGQFSINAIGEAVAVVTFPVSFLEKPNVTFGFEMRSGYMYEQGNMVSATGVVLNWKTSDRPPFSRFYTGCTIGVVSTGPYYQKLIGTWYASGKALVDAQTQYNR
jgi:hypothetical protein